LLPSHPARPHKPTIIKPSFKSFTLFAVATAAWNIKHSTSLGEEENGYENHQKKFISALYFAASKDKLNFISFCAPTSFPVFSLRVLGKYEIFIGGDETEEGRKGEEE
jgi:hypothetical protein